MPRLTEVKGGVKGNTQGRVNRILQILDAMTADERADFFTEVSETYCVECGEELPDEDSKEPDHDCPVTDEDDDGHDGDDGGGDEAGDVEDETIANDE